MNSGERKCPGWYNVTQRASQAGGVLTAETFLEVELIWKQKQLICTYRFLKPTH